jgi:hypothetical protein
VRSLFLTRRQFSFHYVTTWRFLCACDEKRRGEGGEDERGGEVGEERKREVRRERKRERERREEEERGESKRERASFALYDETSPIGLKSKPYVLI